MIRRLLERLLYRRGGPVPNFPPVGEVHRLSRGTAAIPRAAWERYGEDFFTELLPDTDFLIID